MIILFLILGYLSVLLVSTILSFTTKGPSAKRTARITALIMGGLLIMVVFGLWLTARLLFPEPPSISVLAKHFAERRSTLEEIHAMSNQDVHFSRIDPTFINYGGIDGTPGGQSSPGSSDSPLAVDRWAAYRALFLKAKLDQGFTRDADGNVYFMAGSVGLLNNGHTTGYLYCREPGSSASQSSAFQPCMSVTSNHGSQDYSDNPRREAYSFQKVAEHWFVFDQGPS